MVPTFFCGCSASFLSISTYFATLGQLPKVILEKDARYISLPLVLVGLINGLIWTAYAVLKKDIPLFMTNSIACGVLSVNLIFYLWACDMVATSSIQSLMSFIKIAFPLEEEEEQKFADEEAAGERQLDLAEDEQFRAKADLHL